MQGIAQKVLMDPSRYSLAQLQQAVENGVLPAYIGIPIIQEKVQQQKMAQGAGQPPEGPPIAQQIMQQAQAAQGVEALPTNLPQEYAAGGIVAFADGGGVERYQNTGLVGLNPLVGERQAEESFEDFKRRVLQAEAQARQDAAMQENQAREAERLRLLAERGQVIPNRLLVGNTLTAVQPTTTKPTPAAINTDLGPVPGTSDKTSILGGIADARTGAMAPAAAGPGAARPPAVGTPGLGLKADRPVFKAPEGESYADMAGRAFSDFAVRANNRDVEAESKKEAARGKVQGQAFDEYKKALEQEALDAGADKQQAKYMSLFKAGLAMMGGTSRHALENIGKGAMVGAEDYQSALKDLKKADKERRKEFAHIEAARRAEAIGDRDTAIREIDAARDRGESRDRYVNEGIYKAQGMDKAQQYDISKTQFSSDSDLAKTDLAGRYSLAGQNVAAAARLAAAGATNRGALTQGQLLTARMQAMRMVNEDQIRNQVAQRLNFKKAPKPGADAKFDDEVAKAYDQAINAYISRGMGMGTPGGGGSPFQGFRILPDD